MSVPGSASGCTDCPDPERKVIEAAKSLDERFFDGREDWSRHGLPGEVDDLHDALTELQAEPPLRRSSSEMSRPERVGAILNQRAFRERIARAEGRLNGPKRSGRRRRV